VTKKTYVLDTNILLGDPSSLFAFEEHDVIIPLIVLEELDRHKSRPDEVGRNARQVCRKLDELRKDGKSGTLLDGVVLRSGGTLRVQMLNKEHIIDMPPEFEASKVDNLIIVFMMWLKGHSDDEHEPILVSKDINVRIKCDSVGVRCEDYRKMRVATNDQQFYRGVETLEIDESLVDELYSVRQLPLPALSNKKIFPNQIVVVKSMQGGQTKKSAITRFSKSTNLLLPVIENKEVYGLKPRNKEQNFSLDLLLDPEVKLLTLVGPSGTGKTLLALAAALEQLKTVGAKPAYERIIVTRPVQPLGKDIGFLPGTLEEKMQPWIAPIKDNLNFLMGNSNGNRSKARRPSSSSKSAISDEPFLALLQRHGLIEIEAITFIRGRSIPNSFIVIDEAQNLSMHELKTIITRVGDGTKIVLTGDIEQIDNVHVDAFTNGLTYAVERFKEYDIAGHVTLIKGERSELATLASQIL